MAASSIDYIVSAESTLGDVVKFRPELGSVLERMGLDYCCQGKRTLGQACADKSLDGNSIAVTLNAFQVAPGDVMPERVHEWPADRLIQHILDKHHTFIREQAPRLVALADKVSRVHGGKDASYVKVAQEVRGLMDELLVHLEQEERVVFPEILKAAADPSYRPSEALVLGLEDEHVAAGDAMDRIRDLTNSYMPPEWACPTVRVLLDGLHAFESDLHAHVHKENSILFPPFHERCRQGLPTDKDVAVEAV